MNSNDIINAILRREGGYVDHPADKGGPTNHGITLGTLSDWRGRPATAEDVRALTHEQAAIIYRQRYLYDPGLDEVHDDNLQALLVDCAVNHGPGRAVKFLQQALGNVQVDGDLGPRTRTAMNNALNTVGGDCLYSAVLAQRARFYGRIITNNPSQAVFAAGWMARLAEFIEGEVV